MSIPGIRKPEPVGLKVAWILGRYYVQNFDKIKLFKTLALVSAVAARDGKVRKAADASRCPTLELPEGVGDVECDGSMCVAVCEEGKLPIGQMKVKCKESRKKGLFWNKVCRLTKPSTIVS